MHPHQDLLQMAEAAAREAGTYLRQAGDAGRLVHVATARDVKLEADREAERRVRVSLAGTGLAVIGEEEGGDPTLYQGQEPYWVVDPLDGTHNYLRGVPLCCVSIGLMRGDTAILGVIHDFNADATYTGIVAESFAINGQPIEPAWATSKALGTLQTGFPSARDYGEEALLGFVRKVQGYQKTRLLGSAALALAWTAAGLMDCYYEEAVRLWDVAAGIALVQAAGGVVRMSPTPGGSQPLMFDVTAAGSAALMP